MVRLPKLLHAAVRHALRQAWELDDDDNELIKNLTRQEDDAPGVRRGSWNGST